MKRIYKKIVFCVVTLAVSGMLCIGPSSAFADEGQDPSNLTPKKIAASDLTDGASGVVHAQKKSGRRLVFDYGYYKWEFSNGCMTVNPIEGCTDATRSEITAFTTETMFETDSTTGQFVDVPMIKSLVIGDGFDTVRSASALGSLESVQISKDVAEISPGTTPCFSPTLKEVKFVSGSQLKGIGSGSFAGCSVETLDLSGCAELKKLGVFDGGDNPQAGQNGPFGDSNRINEHLKTVLLPNQLEEIGYKTFSRCAVLENIEIPSSVTTIGCRAFDYCTSLSKLVLPTRVASGMLV